VLSQINAARGEDAIDVDAKSESESEEEVSARRVALLMAFFIITRVGRRILFSRLIGAPGSAQAYSRVLSS
jgi:hypothetical protein